LRILLEQQQVKGDKSQDVGFGVIEMPRRREK
jgi:hypothetical protein